MKNKKGIRLCYSFMGSRSVRFWILMLAAVVTEYSAELGLAGLNKNVINSVLSDAAVGMRLLLIWAAVIADLNILKNVFNYLKMRTVRMIMLDLRLGLFSHLEKLPVEYFEKNHSGDSIFKLNSNVETMKRAYTQYTRNIFGGIGGGIVSCMFILAADWRLGLISIGLCALTVFINMKFAPKLRDLGAKIQEAESALTSMLSDLLSGIEVIKLFRSGETAVGRYCCQCEATAGLRTKRIGVMSFNEASNRCMEFMNYFGIITIGAVMALHGMSDIGTVFAITSIQGNVSGLFRNFGSAWSMMQESISAAEMIQSVFSQKPEEERIGSTRVNDISGVSAVRFKNVSFSYDGTVNVLDNISFEAKKGEMTAFVGNSGGGKSTVIRLIPEFYRISGGSIEVFGKNIREYALSELRSLIAYVPQEPYLFDESIMENIRLGRPGASDYEVMEAAKKAKAHDFIENLPHGYSTITGERGEALSGGQRQRIAIARAFLKNAPILLLDEATSALDNENERLVQQSIEELMKNRTTLVVAHRLSTIRDADRIYEIKDGRAVISSMNR